MQCWQEKNRERDQERKWQKVLKRLQGGSGATGWQKRREDKRHCGAGSSGAKGTYVKAKATRAPLTTTKSRKFQRSRKYEPSCKTKPNTTIWNTEHRIKANRSNGTLKSHRRNHLVHTLPWWASQRWKHPWIHSQSNAKPGKKKANALKMFAIKYSLYENKTTNTNHIKSI